VREDTRHEARGLIMVEKVPMECRLTCDMVSLHRFLGPLMTIETVSVFVGARGNVRGRTRRRGVDAVGFTYVVKKDEKTHHNG